MSSYPKFRNDRTHCLRRAAFAPRAWDVKDIANMESVALEHFAQFFFKPLGVQLQKGQRNAAFASEKDTISKTAYFDDVGHVKKSSAA
jgi:hypothetical protein